jgi:nitrate reductase cytochrome c-type subunit
MNWLPAVVLALAFAAFAQGSAAPPIAHSIDGYLVTKQENNCLECHDKPRDIGKKRAKGMPTPLPATHYAKLDGKPEIASTYFGCTTCHKPK